MKIKYFISALFLSLSSCSDEVKEYQQDVASEYENQIDRVSNSNQEEREAPLRSSRDGNQEIIDLEGKSLELYYAEKAQLEYKKAKKVYVGMPDIPEEIEPRVKIRGEIIEVTWPDLEESEIPAPGAGYYAVAQFDRKTGELIHIHASP